MNRLPHYLTIGQDDLDTAPGLPDLYLCPRCGEEHAIQESVPPLLNFVSCQGQLYLIGFKGKLITHLSAGRAYLSFQCRA